VAFYKEETTTFHDASFGTSNEPKTHSSCQRRTADIDLRVARSPNKEDVLREVIKFLKTAQRPITMRKNVRA